MLKTMATPNLRELARRRLMCRLPADEPANIRALRAAGYFVLGSPLRGYLILPPESD